MHSNATRLILNIITSSANKSEVSQFNYNQAYNVVDTAQSLIYKKAICVLATLIVLSNAIVVISSGLILKTGKRPKSTYLLLGNVSLADTIIGLSLIFKTTLGSSVGSNTRCIIQIGMLVGPTMVSIFSVGLIAIDRYIFILYGLYYHRWFNTRRIRFGILYIWISGVAIGFLPAIGLISTEFVHTRCYYTTLFPAPLILLNSILSIIPIIVVTILYFIILAQVLKTVKNIKSTVVMYSPNKRTQLRTYRGTDSDKTLAAYSNESPGKSDKNKIKRSASFNTNYNNDALNMRNNLVSVKAKSFEDLVDSGTNTVQNYGDNGKKKETSNVGYESQISVYSIQSNYSERSSSVPDVRKNTNDVERIVNKRSLTIRKVKEPNKWRATSIVMLTSGSFIITWLPFFVTVIFFVFCKEKLTNPKCMHLHNIIRGPLSALAFLNCILNPLIYAWWHKGFQNSIKMYYRKFIAKNCMCTNCATMKV